MASGVSSPPVSSIISRTAVASADASRAHRLPPSRFHERRHHLVSVDVTTVRPTRTISSP
jgi:hypothetical protein